MKWCPWTTVLSRAASGFPLVQGSHGICELQPPGSVVIMCSFGFWSFAYWGLHICRRRKCRTHFHVRQGCPEASPCLLWSLSWSSFLLNRKTPNTGPSKKEEAVLLVSIKCSFQSYLKVPRRCCFVILGILMSCGLLDYCDCIHCCWL